MSTADDVLLRNFLTYESSYGGMSVYVHMPVHRTSVSPCLFPLCLSVCLSGCQSVFAYLHRVCPSFTNVKFPDIDSFLSDGSKYSVLIGQLHRFVRICQRRKDFLFRAHQLISYLIAKGYKRRILFGRTLSFMRKFDFRYDVKNVKDFVFRLFASVK